MKKFNIILISAALLLSSCSRQDAPVKVVGEKVSSYSVVAVTMKEFRLPPVLPDSTYRYYDLSDLDRHYQEYKQDLFNKGVVKWNRTFDCNRFSQSFASFIQIKYFSESFHQFGSPEAILVGEVYYTDDERGNHAINVFLTKNGFVFFEPQTGKLVNLSANERGSVSFIKF